MVNKKYYCKDCDITFERVSVSENEIVKCPLCGSQTVELKNIEEKKPIDCNASSKYT